jgi:hypothetical protein
MPGRERSRERWQRNGQEGICGKYKNSTNEATISLKTQKANRNEAKKQLKTKELFDFGGAKAKKCLKYNELSFLKVTNLVVLCARKDANSPQNKQKCPVKLKTKRSFRVEPVLRITTTSRLHEHRTFTAVAHARPRERGHPARSGNGIAARQAGRMPALQGISERPRTPGGLYPDSRFRGNDVIFERVLLK